MTERFIEDVLAAGLRWLYQTEQPEDAILQHHGVTLVGDRSRSFPAINRARLMGFAPAAADGSVVVWTEVAGNDYDDRAEPLHRLLPEELEVMTRMIESLGETVARTWNGHPAPTGSLALERPAHPTLAAAVKRYNQGCSDHPAKGVFCQCDWYRIGREKLRLPEIGARGR